MNSIGQRIKQARMASRLSQDELARACGWDSQGRISNYERGLREPKRGDLARISAALNVSQMWLITGEGEIAQAREMSEGSRVINEPRQIHDIQLPKIPLLPIEQAHSSEVEPLSYLEAGSDPRFADAFAVVVDDETMSPLMLPNDKVFLSRNIRNKKGCYALVRIDNRNINLIVKYQEIAGEPKVAFLNAEYPLALQAEEKPILLAEVVGMAPRSIDGIKS